MTDFTTLKQEYIELLRQRHVLELNECLDPYDPNSRPTPVQQTFFDAIDKYLIRWAVCGNRAGKTSCGGRECSWIFNENHPTFKRPKEWGNGPLTLIVLGRVGEQIESEIWQKKIKPFLQEGSFKEVRTGNQLQRVIHKENGNVIIFQSHHHAEEAREKVQAHTAHWVWVDEMPGSARLITELLMRVTTTRGRFIATFTPLIRNLEIKKLVDNENDSKAIRFNFLPTDNPVFKGREEEVLREIRAMCASEVEYRCRAFGAWMSPGTAVFKYDEDKNKRELGEIDYSTTWRHVVVVDPAASGKAGLSVWAEHPAIKLWYCVKAKYLEGDAAYTLVKNVEKELEGLNVVERICDCNPSGFYKEAQRQGIKYKPVTDKQYQKAEFIEATNTALSLQEIYLTEGADILAEELITACWSETGELRIVNGSRFHTADTMQYFVKNKPKPELLPRATQTPLQALRNMHLEQAVEYKKKITKHKMRNKYGRRFSR